MAGIRTRHWAFGVGLPTEMISMGLAHSQSSGLSEAIIFMSVLGTLVAGFHDLFHNSGKN